MCGATRIRRNWIWSGSLSLTIFAPFAKSPPHGWNLPDLNGIHPPESEVEECGEAHPGEVGGEQPGGGLADREEAAECEEDGEPEGDDLHQRPAQFMCAEEDRRPCGVPGELDEVEYERLSPSGAPPHHPGGHGHHHVEQRPDRTEDPAGRIPCGLVEGGIPLVGHGEDAEQGRAEGEYNEADEC